MGHKKCNCRICRAPFISDTVYGNVIFDKVGFLAYNRLKFLLFQRNFRPHSWGQGNLDHWMAHNKTIRFWILDHWQAEERNFLYLVPATCCRDKSHCVNWPFVPQRLVSGIQTSLNFWAGPRDLFLKMLQVNCLWDKSLRPVPLCKLFRGLVAGTTRRD